MYNNDDNDGFDEYNAFIEQQNGIEAFNVGVQNDLEEGLIDYSDISDYYNELTNGYE